MRSDKKNVRIWLYIHVYDHVSCIKECTFLDKREKSKYQNWKDHIHSWKWTWDDSLSWFDLFIPEFIRTGHFPSGYFYRKKCRWTTVHLPSSGACFLIGPGLWLARNWTGRLKFNHLTHFCKPQTRLLRNRYEKIRS